LKKLRLSLCLLLVSALIHCAAGELTQSELSMFAQNKVAPLLASRHVPGAVFVVVQGERVLFAQGAGLCDCEANTAMTPDTIVRVASISKPLTATALMQLSEQGRLKLDLDINASLKKFKIANDFSPAVTLRNLLTHSGGFDERKIGMGARTIAEVRPLGEYLSERMPPRVRPCGQVSKYSNHGFALAGLLVEETAGVPFAEYMEQNVFLPLGMTHSSFDPRKCGTPPVGYEWKDGTRKRTLLFFDNLTPAGGLYTTGNDMARFMIAQLNGGRCEKGRILSAESVAEMQRVQIEHHPQLQNSGLGFFITQRGGQRIVEHSGGYPGVSSLMWLLPESKVGCLLVCNISDSPVTFEIQRAFLERFFPPSIESLPVKGPAMNPELLCGVYRSVRQPRRSIEMLAALTEDIEISALPKGLLNVNFGACARSYQQHEGLLFRDSLDAQSRLAFRLGPDGTASHVFIEQWPYEKLEWYETPHLHLALFGALSVVFLSFILIWPASWLFRRLRGTLPAGEMRAPLWLACAVSVLNLFFLISIALLFNFMDRDALMFGMPAHIIALLTVPLLTTVGAITLSALTVSAWRHGRFSVWERILCGLVSAASIAFIPLLKYWNLLGFYY